VRYALDVPNFDRWAHPAVVAEAAAAAEQAGWDRFSIWDHMYPWEGLDVGDPWISLSAAAERTDHIRLMVMVTPLPRRMPWKVARESVALDLLSGGRLVLGVGIGFPVDTEFGAFGLPTDDRTRADQLDESLAVLTGLWTGEPFTFRGDHYSVGPVTFTPTPLQRPRIPIWVAGMWPARRPFRRAARYDGVAPIVFEGGDLRNLEPDDLRRIVAYVKDHREDEGPFDVCAGGMALAAHRPAGQLDEMASAGATWWRETFDPWAGVEFDDWWAKVREGPPQP
jgi:alkanesulfonate monooxygenase SsuD/methylene tetrahydromethanopterin reductase-like flavin-dependent oxidoreductase (luciferase family)